MQEDSHSWPGILKDLNPTFTNERNETDLQHVASILLSIIIASLILFFRLVRMKQTSVIIPAIGTLQVLF
jgi:hypothetical protein